MATLIGSLTVVLTAVMALSNTAVAWNIPGHMLSGAIAYQVLKRFPAVANTRHLSFTDSFPRRSQALNAQRRRELPLLPRRPPSGAR